MPALLTAMDDQDQQVKQAARDALRRFEHRPEVKKKLNEKDKGAEF